MSSVKVPRVSAACVSNPDYLFAFVELRWLRKQFYAVDRNREDRYVSYERNGVIERTDHGNESINSYTVDAAHLSCFPAVAILI